MSKVEKAGARISKRKFLTALATGVIAAVAATTVLPQQAHALNYITNSNFSANSGYFTGSDWWVVQRHHQSVYNGSWHQYSGFSSAAFGWDSTQTAGGEWGSGEARRNGVEIQRDSNGNFYAELCAYEAGTAIYQDITTEPGVAYRVTLKHCSLSNEYIDKMQVRIGNQSSQAAINMYRSAGNASGAQRGAGHVGTTISTAVSNGGVRDHGQQWCTYYGYYVCPANQWTTRFTFRALDSRALNLGNLVDDITFSTLYPLYYDANGGTGMVPTPVASGVYPGYYEYTGSPITLASNGTSTCNITRPGYTFMGWSTTKYPAANSPEELARMTRGYQYTMKQSGSGNRVYAVWVKSPSITFKTEYGQTVKERTVYSYGTKVSAPTAPSLDHQRFDGWTVESGDQGYATTGLTRDTVVVAQYTPLYDVRFFNGVTDEQIGTTQIIPEHGDATVPTPPVNRGYTFIKWDRPATNIVRNTDITAQYRAHRYQVHYNENGSNVRGVTPNSNHVYDQAKENTINGFTRPGYNFRGWSLTPDGIKQYEDRQSVINLTDQDNAVVEMYAIWEEKEPVPIEYTVEFAHEGTVTRKAELVRPATGEPNGSMSMEYPGYTFDHWRDGTTWLTRTEDAKWVPTRNNDLIHYANTYIAYFHPHEYDVAYHQNAANVINNMENSHHVFDEAKELNKNKFVRPGYVFVGWSRDKDSPVSEFSDAAAVLNLTEEDGSVVDLYAIWAPTGGVHVSYKSEDVSKGRVSTSDEYLVADSSISQGSRAIPARGYHFVRWVKNDNTVKLTEHVNADRNLAGVFYEQSYIAIFAENTYSVKYDKNAPDADGYMPNQYFEYEDKKPLDLDAYERPGYEFVGWSTTPDGDVEYLDGQEVTKLTDENGGEVILYAVWKSAEVVIEYRSEDASRGSVSVAEERINPVTGVPGGSIASPTRGYKMKNWTDSSGTVTSSAADIVPTKSLTSGVYETNTYTAHFAPIAYSISFNRNSPSATGEMPRMENIAYDAPTELVANSYAHRGHVFIGWSRDPGASVAEFADKQIVTNLADVEGTEVVLYAVWAEQDDVVINYRISDEEGGSVSVSSESVAPFSGNVTGSVVSINPGWKFTGWTTQDGKAVGQDELLVPRKTDGLYVTDTYVAHVERVGYPVTFIDEVTGEVFAQDEVLHDADAKMPPVVPQHDGYKFIGFDDDGKNVIGEREIHAKYERIICKVEFVDDLTGKVIATVEVPWGDDVEIIDAAEHDGYEFLKWDHDGKAIKEDTKITAYYDKLADPAPAPEEPPADNSGVADDLVNTQAPRDAEVPAQEEIAGTGVAAPIAAGICVIVCCGGIMIARLRRK